LVHLPHFDFSLDADGSSGALVSTVPHLTLGPLCGVINKQLLPIHPSPARFAAILWENSAQMRWLSILSEAGTGKARKPARSISLASLLVTWSNRALITL
jgi:hypothetical protein